MSDNLIHAPVHPVASTSLHALQPAQVVPPPARVQPTTVPAPEPVYSALSDSELSSDEDEEPDWNEVSSLVEAAFTPDEVDEMVDHLKERGIFAFLNRYLVDERVPPAKLLLIFGCVVPPEASQDQQIRLIKMYCSRVLRRRDKLEQYNTVDDAVHLIRSSKNILVLTGAGVSTSCGIPDFRSPTGLYARLKEEHWELEDPQQMFDLPYFKEQPNVFYSFAKEIYPSNFVPSPCHRFVRLLELNDKLLRNYTQNIDGLFESVGVKRMLNCHGSFATASCLRCRTQFPGSAIEADIFASRVALCPLCTSKDEEASKLAPPKKARSSVWREEGDSSDEDDGKFHGEWEGKPLVKPDIVFFGEMLSDEFDHKLFEDREKVDLLIVIGTSLRVAPVASIVSHLPHSVPQIVINRDPITHANFDIHLIGDGDTIVSHLCAELSKLSTQPTNSSPHLATALGEWNLGRVPVRTTGNESVKAEKIVPERVGDSHVWLFPGADREHKWTKAVRKAFGGGGTSEDSDEGSPPGEINTPKGSDDDESESEEEAKVGVAGLSVLSSAEVSRPGSRARSEEEDERRAVEEPKKARLG